MADGPLELLPDVTYQFSGVSHDRKFNETDRIHTLSVECRQAFTFDEQRRWGIALLTKPVRLELSLRQIQRRGAQINIDGSASFHMGDGSVIIGRIYHGYVSDDGFVQATIDWPTRSRGSLGVTPQGSVGFSIDL